MLLEWPFVAPMLSVVPTIVVAWPIQFVVAVELEHFGSVEDLVIEAVLAGTIVDSV